jgi:glycosyltransferase involved in cell wall biosynthesis
MISKNTSVVTRTYNSRETIGRAIDSVLDQTADYSEYEVVVIDDGSTDGTTEIVSEYVDEYPSTVCLVSTGHSGPITTLNEGISRALGQYITIVDADDAIREEFVERTTEILDRQREIDYVYTDYVEIEEDGSTEHVDPSDDILKTVAGGILFRKSALESAGLYDEEIFFPEYDMLMKLEERGREGHHVGYPLFEYHRQEDSLTKDADRVREGKRELKERYGDDFSVRDY